MLSITYKKQGFSKLTLKTLVNQINTAKLLTLFLSNCLITAFLHYIPLNLQQYRWINGIWINGNRFVKGPDTCSVINYFNWASAAWLNGFFSPTWNRTTAWRTHIVQDQRCFAFVGKFKLKRPISALFNCAVIVNGIFKFNYECWVLTLCFHVYCNRKKQNQKIQISQTRNWFPVPNRITIQRNQVKKSKKSIRTAGD